MRVILLAVAPFVLSAQTLTLERGRDSDDGRFHVTGNTVLFQSVPLGRVLQFAYEIAPARLSGPSALDEFVDGKFEAPGMSNAQMRAAFRIALEQKLGIVATRKSEEMPVLILKKGTQPLRLKEAAGKPNLQGFSGGVRGEAVPVRMLAATLERRLERPVIDETGLTGTYDFETRWNSDDAGDIAAGLRKLGLDLVPDKRVLARVVIEKISIP